MARSNISQKKEQNFYQRKNPRISFVKNQLLTAKCETIDSMFSVSVQDLSSGGAFIYTKRKLRLGQEIAMTIKLPDAAEFFLVTGEVVRISAEGYGVKFKIIFNE